MGDYWGINSALDGLTLALIGFSIFLLTGLTVVSINYLRPKGDRLCWSLAAVEGGALLFGLAWYTISGAM
jgi:hypothetical protein